MTVRVGICIPTGGSVKTKFLNCLIGMMNFCEAPFYFYSCEGSLLPKNRQGLVLRALGDGCTHVLFIDSDMTFPACLVDKMLQADKDVLGINCTGRKLPLRFMAEDNGRQIVTDKDSSGLCEVNRVGTGVMMIKAEVFDRIEKPWFILGYNPDTDLYTGEDYWFCQRCRKAGVSVYIDHDLSKSVGHVGDYIYGPE